MHCVMMIIIWVKLINMDSSCLNNFILNIRKIKHLQPVTINIVKNGSGNARAYKLKDKL